MGFFEKFVDSLDEWDLPWGKVVSELRTSRDSIWNAAKSFYAAAGHLALTPIASPLGDLSPRLAWQEMKRGFGQTLGGVGSAFGALSDVPVFRQAFAFAESAATDLVKRPLATATLVSGDVYRTGGPGVAFNREQWRKSYNTTTYVTPGQAWFYLMASGVQRASDIVGMEAPSDIQRRNFLREFPTFGVIAQRPEDLDPRGREQRRQYYDNPYMKTVSGALDFGITMFADPTIFLGKGAAALKLRYWSNQMKAPALAAGRHLKFQESGAYQKAKEYIQEAANPEVVAKTVFANKYNGDTVAQLLWSVVKDQQQYDGGKDLYDLTWLALYGDNHAWQQLADDAPRVADVIGTKFANYTIANVGKNVGLGDKIIDDQWNALRETKEAAFADAMTAGHGVFGQLGKGVEAGGLLTGQPVPRLRLSSKWRAGVHQWLRNAPATTLGYWARRSRLLLPSSRTGRMVDLNDINSTSQFRSNLEASRLPQRTVDYWVSAYARASSPEGRFAVYNAAENAAFKVHAARFGFTVKQVEALLPTINKWRTGNRQLLGSSRRFASSAVRRRYQQLKAQGREREAQRALAMADEIDQAVARGDLPVAHYALPDEDGNLALIPEDADVTTDKPILLSQHADVVPVVDWSVLDNALWWQTRGIGKRTVTGPAGTTEVPDVTKLGWGSAVYSGVDAVRALTDAAMSVWKVSAILRPGYIWRALSDESGRIFAKIGAGRQMATMAGAPGHSVNNMMARGRLLSEIVRSKVVARRANRMPDILVDGKVMDESDGISRLTTDHPLLARMDSIEPALLPAGFEKGTKYTVLTHRGQRAESGSGVVTRGRAGLTDEENTALDAYAAGQVARAINDRLRAGRPLEGQTYRADWGEDIDLGRTQAAMDSAIAASRLERDAILWRGLLLTPREANNFSRVGSVISDPGYTSTSLTRFESSQVVQGWQEQGRYSAGAGAEPYMMKILAPAGTPAATGAFGIHEVVLQRNQQMRVLAYDQEKREILVGLVSEIERKPLAAYASYEMAFADGLLEFDDLLERVGAHGRAGVLPPALAELFGAWRDGAIPETVYRKNVLNYVLTRAERGAFVSPAWQQAFIDEVVKARTGKKRGRPGQPIIAEIGRPVETVAAMKAAVSGQDALDATPAKLKRAAEGHYGNYEGEELTGPEGIGSVRALSEYEGVEYQQVNSYLRRGPRKVGPKNPSDPYDPAGFDEDFNQENAARVAEIDKTMAVSRLQSDVKVYRTIQHGSSVFGKDWHRGVIDWDADLDVQDSQFEQWKAGARPNLTGLRWQELTYISTTADPTVAKSIGSPWREINPKTEGEPTIMAILVPEGVGGVQLAEMGDAAEILLERGLTMEVVADHGVDADGFRRLDVRVVPGAELNKSLGGIGPRAGVLIDPNTGLSPKMRPADVVDKFALDNMRVIPNKPDGFDIDDVYDYIAENANELLKPNALLHGYVTPDGGIALSIAHAVDPKKPIKPTAGKRIKLGKFKGDPYEDSGTATLRINTGGGPVYLKGAFEGQEGDLFRHQTSSRGVEDAWIDTATDLDFARLAAKSGRWVDVGPDDQRAYKLAWERAANLQLSNDPVARMYLQGASVDDVISWLHNTPKGRAYQWKMGPWRSRYADQVQVVRAMVDVYVPMDGDRLAASEALRKKVLAGNATVDDLAKVRPREDMPTVHGASLEYATGSGIWMDWLKKRVDSTFKWLSDIPNDKFVRHPFAADRYRLHATELARARTVQVGKGATLSIDDLKAIEREARSRANRDVRRYLYESTASLDLAKALRLFVPFGSAIADSTLKWGVVLRENPWVALQVWKVWSAPERAGLVQDEDGNQLALEDGKEVWYAVHPLTGERTRLKDHYPKQKMIVFRLPSWMSPESVGETRPVVRINKEVFHTFLDIPTAGPLVSVPVNEFSLSHPEFADNKFVRQFILPFGPSANPTKVGLPGNVRNMLDRFVEQDGEEAQAQATAIYMTEMVNHARGLRPNPPTFEEAREKANALRGLRFWSRFAGVSPQFASPYQPFVDYHHMLEELEYTERTEAQMAGRDPSAIKSADERFYEEMGPEYFALTFSVTRNTLGIPATVEASRQYKRFKDLMERHPELAPLISGAEGAGSFSKAVYEAQRQTRMRYGSAKTMREILSPEDAWADVMKRRGWIEYGKLMDAIEADMALVGATSLEQKSAAKLKVARDRWISSRMFVDSPYGGRVIHPWYQDFKSFDTSKMTARLASMRQIIQDKRLQGRNDIAGLIDYLTMRDEFKNVMNARKYKTLDSVKAKRLRLQWQSTVFRLKQDNLAFAQLYDRWLTNDRYLEAV